jgi:fluoroquinolone resistance protein
MSELQQPFFNGIDWSIIIDGAEVRLKPHETYTGISFKRVSFNSLNLFFCTFEKCSFTECDLTNADFSHSNFNQVRFLDCNMSSFILIFGKISNCELCSCDLSFTRMTNVDVYRSKICGCQLTAMRISSSKITYSLISECSVDGAVFRDAMFFMSNLRHLTAINRPLRMNRTYFVETNLTKVDAHYAKIFDVTWDNSRLIACNFWKSVFKSVKFEDSKIYYSGFNELKIVDTVFFETLLNSNRMRLAVFKYCIFERCDLTNSVMEAADLSDTVFDEMFIEGNGFGEETEFPTIFP